LLRTCAAWRAWRCAVVVQVVCVSAVAVASSQHKSKQRAEGAVLLRDTKAPTTHSPDGPGHRTDGPRRAQTRTDTPRRAQTVAQAQAQTRPDMAQTWPRRLVHVILSASYPHLIRNVLSASYPHLICDVYVACMRICKFCHPIWAQTWPRHGPDMAQTRTDRHRQTQTRTHAQAQTVAQTGTDRPRQTQTGTGRPRRAQADAQTAWGMSGGGLSVEPAGPQGRHHPSRQNQGEASLRFEAGASRRHYEGI
jgi:hypothetical protein